MSGNDNPTINSVQLERAVVAMGRQVGTQMCGVVGDPPGESLGEAGAQVRERRCLRETTPGVQPVLQATRRHVGHLDPDADLIAERLDQVFPHREVVGFTGQ
jgi:hypothetical protein